MPCKDGQLVLRCRTDVCFIWGEKIISQECHGQPTWSHSEPASSRLCCMANCSRSSSSSLMLSLCLPPSMVYPEGASNTHGGISPARHDTAAHRGEVKGKRREGYLTVEEIILKEKNRKECRSEKKKKSKSKLYQVFFFPSYAIAAKIFTLINNVIKIFYIKYFQNSMESISAR